MNDSLTWLRDPQTGPALSELLCGLITDIRLILVHPDLGNAAKLGAITQTVDQLAPPPGLDAGAAPAAAAVAGLLARGAGPATALFERLAGERMRIELAGCADRPLSVTECLELHASPGAHGYHRTGRLCGVDSGLVAAEVSSLVIAGRLPTAACRSLGIPGPEDPAPPPSSIPLGTVLAGFGVHREPLGARMVQGAGPDPAGRVSVESSARMWLGGVPVALARERVTAEFCRQVRGRLAAPADDEAAAA
jgi:hypothetical protein